MAKINLFSTFGSMCVLVVMSTIGVSVTCQSVDPPKISTKTSTDCPFRSSEDCYLTCQITHTTLYKLDLDTVCQWTYKSDKNVAGITISSPGCVTLDGNTEETSVSLANVGQYAGFYQCHAEYTSSATDPQQVNGYIQLAYDGVNLDGECSDTSDCKTYRATCEKYNDTVSTCKCSGSNSKQYEQKDKDGVSYVVACYNDNDKPQEASSNMPIGGLFVVVAMSLLSLWGTHV